MSNQISNSTPSKPEWFISFSEMLDPATLDELGISADRNEHQCIVRLCAAFSDTREELNQIKQRIGRLIRSIEGEGQ